MNEPPEITAALQQIEQASNPNRQLARKRIAQFKLDREKGEKPLPMTNIHDDKGAPVLDVNEVVRRSYPSYTEKDK